MRKFQFVFVLAFVFGVAGLAHAKKGAEFVKIVVQDDTRASKAELRDRIERLERAVLELQQHIWTLEGGEGAYVGVVGEVTPPHTCFIETPFHGTFSETRSTETAAKGAVMAKCGKATQNSVHCKSSKVKCGQ